MSEDLSDEELAAQRRRLAARHRDEHLTDLWEAECAALMDALVQEPPPPEPNPQESHPIYSTLP